MGTAARGHRRRETQRRPRHGKTPPPEWSLLSAHGRVLFYIALHPGASVPQIAAGLGLTERSIWSAVGALRRSNMLITHAEGRRHRYTVNLDAAYPGAPHLTLRSILGRAAQSAAGRSHR